MPAQIVNASLKISKVADIWLVGARVCRVTKRNNDVSPFHSTNHLRPHLHRYLDLLPVGENEMPPDIAVESLRDDQVNDLNRLREWLYRKRTQVRLDGE